MAVRTISASGGTRNSNDTASFDEGALCTASDDLVARGDGTSGNLTINAAFACRSADFTNYAGTLTHNAFNWSIGTSTANGTTALKFVPGMGYSAVAGSTITLVSTSSTRLGVTMAGKQPVGFTINGSGGKWTLLDALTTTGIVSPQLGDIDFGSFAHVWQRLSFSGTGVRVLTFNNSTISISSTSPISNTATAGVTISANTAVITFTGASASVTLGGVNWNGLTLVAAGTGAVTFVTNGGQLGGLQIVSTGTARTVTFAAGQTYTIATPPVITGRFANLVSVVSSSAGTPAILSVPSGTVLFDYASIKDITATGGATFNAKHAVNVSGNSGINFVPVFTGPRWGSVMA